MRIEIYRWGEAVKYPPPERKTTGSVGYDLRAAEDAIINPGIMVNIPHNIILAPPRGIFFLVLPRSSMFQRGLIMPVGLIDPDYRGPMVSPLYNYGKSPARIRLGERVSQVVFLGANSSVTWLEVYSEKDLPSTDRGDGGFGSTGKS